MRKTHVYPTDRTKDANAMIMHRERGEAVDLGAVLTVGEKVPREIQTLLTRREVTEREGASKEEEEAEECEVAEVEGDAGDLDAEEALEEEAAAAASGGSESLKEEAEVIGRKSSFYAIHLC